MDVCEAYLPFGVPMKGERFTELILNEKKKHVNMMPKVVIDLSEFWIKTVSQGGVG